MRLSQHRNVQLLWLTLLSVFTMVIVIGCSSITTARDTITPGKAETAANNNSSTSPAKSINMTQGQKLRVHYIDVGQGDSILIQVPNGKNVLIDAGTRQESKKVISYLQGQNIKKLDIIIATHPHEDHIGSMDDVIRTFDIGQVVMPKKDANTATYKDLLLAIASKGLKITPAKAGLKLDLGPETSAELIAPNSGSYEDINNYSAVLKLVYGKNGFLFTGDAQSQSEQEMINAGFDIKADVLKVGHHGSYSSTTSPFLAKVSPLYAVISCGKGNSYGHPHHETLDKLAAAGVKVYRTDQDGTIIAESDGTNISFSTGK